MHIDNKFNSCATIESLSNHVLTAVAQDVSSKEARTKKYPFLRWSKRGEAARAG